MPQNSPCLEVSHQRKVPISRSNNNTARLIQNTATRISAKKPKNSRYWDSTYLSNRDTAIPPDLAKLIVTDLSV